MCGAGAPCTAVSFPARSRPTAAVYVRDGSAGQSLAAAAGRIWDATIEESLKMRSRAAALPWLM